MSFMGTPYRILSFCVVAVLTTALYSHERVSNKTGNQAGDILISYKGNMGVLISDAKTSVLIDGLHEYYGAGYLNTPNTELSKLLQRRDPYANLSLALFTHFHKDHYSEKLANNFIQSSSNTRVVGAPQVIDALDANRTVTSWNRNSILVTDSATGLALYGFNLPHTGRDRHATVQNVAYYLKMGRTTILHVGDADTDLAAFNGLQLSKVDAAIVPVWFLMNDKGTRIIKEILKPRIVIATHISPNEKQSMEKYRLPGIQTFFFREINQAVKMRN